jgi:hypothetical protein
VDLRELAKAAEALSEVESLVFSSDTEDTASSSSSSFSSTPPSSSSSSNKNSQTGKVALPVDSMRGISVVEQEAAFVRRLGQGVRQLAAAKLREGIAGLNQADVGGALQVTIEEG